MNPVQYVEELGQKAKKASGILATAPTTVKNNALLSMADAFEEHADELKAANALDMKAGKEKGLLESTLDRLLLTDKRIHGMAEGVRQVAALPDPVGEIIHGTVRPNGLVISKVRVPLGVIAIIYESRPNVTADAASLCLKSGNAVILRGGSEAIHSNKAIAEIISRCIKEAGLPEDCVQFVDTTDRAAAERLMTLNKYVDVLIPRGGHGLVKAVVEKATMPVIYHADGNCHVFVDASADLEMAVNIAYNAKVQRPGVCNAMETLLVHKDIADQFIPKIFAKYHEAGVELRGCERTLKIDPDIKAATEEDWATEYWSLILAVKIVDSLDEAIEHINKYGSKHSDAIVTRDYFNSKKFAEQIDSAAVFINTSTRFSDGFEFGLGAEMGISTQKLHARGPVGLEELTSYKYVVLGNGQLRS